MSDSEKPEEKPPKRGVPASYTITSAHIDVVSINDELYIKLSDAARLTPELIAEIPEAMQILLRYEAKTEAQRFSQHELPERRRRRARGELPSSKKTQD